MNALPPGRLLALVLLAASLTCGTPLARSQPADPLPAGAVARLGTTRFRHNDLVLAVAWSPDGKVIASASQDRTVRLWDAADGKELARFEGHTGFVYGVAFSPDGKTVASCSQDKTTCLWDAAARGRGVRPLQFTSHPDAVLAVLFTPDGKALISGSSDGIVLIEVDTGKEQRRFGAPEGKARRLVLSRDGKTLAAAHSIGPVGKTVGRIVLWDPATGTMVQQLGKDQKEIYSLAFSPDGDTLVSGTDDGPKLWEVASGSAVEKLRDLPLLRYTPSVGFSPDGKTLFAGGSGFLREWTAATGRPMRSLDVGSLYVYSLAFSPDGKTLAAGTTRAVMLWDVASGKPKHPEAGHQGEVAALLFTRDGKELWTAGYDRPIYRWDVSTAKEVGRLLAPTSSNGMLALSADGKTMATIGPNLAIILLDTTTGKERSRFLDHLPPRTSAFTSMNVLFTPDGKRVVSTAMGIDPHIRVWEADTGKEVLKIDTGKDRKSGDHLVSLAISPDARTLYSSSLMGGVRVWDLLTGKELRQIGKPGVGVTRLALSGDGRRLAGVSGQFDEGVVVWDAASGAVVCRFARPGGNTPRLAFSPDGRTLAVVSETDPVRLWEIASAQKRLEFKGHNGPVKAIAFSPDGRLFSTGGDDTTVLVWDLHGLPFVGLPAVAGVPLKVTETQWVDLAGDAPTGFRAVSRLVAHPKEAVALLAAHLRPGEGKSIDKLIADLDDDEFATRESATKQLELLGRAAEEALRKALAGKPSAEMRSRIDRILAAPKQQAADGETRLRSLRAPEALEMIGTPEARKILEAMAKGAPEAEITVEAKAVLARMPVPK